MTMLFFRITPSGDIIKDSNSTIYKNEVTLHNELSEIYFHAAVVNVEIAICNFKM